MDTGFGHITIFLIGDMYHTIFGHLTIFLIGEAKLREVMETVLPRVLPVDVNLKPFSIF